MEQQAMREEKISVWNDQLQMRVKVAGSGPPVVYFHPAAGLLWNPFLDRLTENYTVYAPEHPGTSADDTFAIHQVDTLWDLILIYEELIRRLDLTTPAAIGQSYGGMIACELAAHYPDLFSKMVLQPAIGLWREDAPVANWIATPPEELPELLFNNPGSDAAQAMLALPEDEEAAIAAQVGLVWALGSTGKFVWPIPDRGLSKRLHRVNIPTLILWGKEDRLTPAVYAEEFGRRIANSHIEVIEQSGHIVEVEQMEITYALVSEFLSS